MASRSAGQVGLNSISTPADSIRRRPPARDLADAVGEDFLDPPLLVSSGPSQDVPAAEAQAGGLEAEALGAEGVGDRLVEDDGPARGGGHRVAEHRRAG